MHVMFVLPGSFFLGFLFFSAFLLLRAFLFETPVKKGAHDSPGCILGNVGHQRWSLNAPVYYIDALFLLIRLVFFPPFSSVISSAAAADQFFKLSPVQQHLVTALIDIHPHHVMNDYMHSRDFCALQQIAPKLKKKTQ